MRLREVKVLLFLAVAGVTFAMSGTKASAQGLSSLLPSAGFGSQIEGGVTVKEVKEEVKQIVASADCLDISDADAVETTVTMDKELVDIVIPEVTWTPEDELNELYKNLVIAQVDNYVNVRGIPSEEGEIVGKLYNNSVGDFLEEEDGWYKIQSGNCTGYVKGEYCVTGEEAIEVAKEVGRRIATVNTVTLRVRQEPSMEAATLGLVPIEDQLLVSEEQDGWVRVDIEEGFGYVSAEYVTLTTEFVTAESKEEEEARLKKEKEERDKANAAAAAKAAKQAAQEAAKAAKEAGVEAPAAPPAPVVSSGGAGSNVASYALQFVGNPYVFGGSSLTNGTDCSGFVMSVYANFGVGLPHSSSGDRNVGYDVGGLENAIPGDIICYSGHVGIYIGNGQIVHASTQATGIKISNALYRSIITVRRIV